MNMFVGLGGVVSGMLAKAANASTAMHAHENCTIDILDKIIWTILGQLPMLLWQPLKRNLKTRYHTIALHLFACMGRQSYTA